MPKCDKCKKEINIFQIIIHKTPKGNKIGICEECNKTIDEVEKNEIIKEIENAPEIKCPFCEKKFKKLTAEQYKVSAELNVLKWLIVPVWGLAGSLKNKPYIECPHCKMKIMQG